MKFREVETAFVAQAAVTSIVVLIMLMLLKNQREIESSLKKFAAKEELEKFAPKEELQKFAAKDELPKKANQEELRKLAEQVTQLEKTINEAYAAPYSPNDPDRPYYSLRLPHAASPYAASTASSAYDESAALGESIRRTLIESYSPASAAFDENDEARLIKTVIALSESPMWRSVPEELRNDFYEWVKIRGGEVQDNAVPERLKDVPERLTDWLSKQDELAADDE